MDEENQTETHYSNALEVSQGAADEPSAKEATGGDAADTAEQQQQNVKLPLGQYLCSGDFREIICCFIFGVLCMLTQWPGIALNYRPIPNQVLENSGDIVINLNNAEEYVGDTVSSTYENHYVY